MLQHVHLNYQTVGNFCAVKFLAGIIFLASPDNVLHHSHVKFLRGKLFADQGKSTKTATILPTKISLFTVIIVTW